MNARSPYVSGQFYEADPVALRQQVLRYLPKTSTQQFFKGAQVPHAGLMYSGRVAGSVYASIQWPKTVIFLGPNHTGRGPSLGLSMVTHWQTPLGDIPVDQEVAHAVLDRMPEVEVSEAAHDQEHAIEVQLPFLQVLSKEVKIVPITLGYEDPEQYHCFGESLASLVESSGKDLVVIASSDMTHYEPDADAQEKDHYAIEAILALDSDELARRISQRRISMCGRAPVLALLSYLKARRGESGKLIQYETSGTTSGDYSSVVGYAGILFP